MKKILSILLILVLALSLVACGEKKEESFYGQSCLPYTGRFSETVEKVLPLSQIRDNVSVMIYSERETGGNSDEEEIP